MPGTLEVLDRHVIAKDVQELADSEEPVAILVREALQVIEEALDTHGSVCSLRSFPIATEVALREILLGKNTFRSASTAEKTVGTHHSPVSGLCARLHGETIE